MRLRPCLSVRSVTRLVTVSGNCACVISGNRRLGIIDVSNPGAPVSAGPVRMHHNAGAVFVAGEHAYVAGFEEDWYFLSLIDVDPLESPPSPVVGSVSTGASAIAVTSEYAYVAAGGAGLQVVDIGDPGEPEIEGSVYMLDDARDVAVAGDYACVADRTAGLQIVDISRPSSPKIVGSVNTPGNADGVDVSGEYAYVADGRSGLQVIDIGILESDVGEERLGPDRAASDSLNMLGGCVLGTGRVDLFAHPSEERAKLALFDLLRDAREVGKGTTVELGGEQVAE